MPYTGTPDEIRAKRHAKYLHNRDTILPKQKARDAARKASMTPEEWDAFKARQREAVRRYEKKHRAKRIARKKTPQHRAKANAQMRALRAKDPEKTRAKALARYAADPARAIAYVLKWAKKHPESVQAAIQRRRARLAQAPINDVTPEQRKLVLAAAYGRCVYCPHYNPGCRRCAKGTHTDLTVDHISPVGPEGPNTLSNLIAACSSCNPKKSRKVNPVPVQPFML